MISLIRNEMMKIFSRASSWIYMLIIVAVVFLFGLVFRGDPILGKGTETTWDFMHISIMIGMLVTLFSVIVSSGNVAAEFSRGTIKQLLIRPHARWKILLSKYIAVTIYSFLLLLVLYLSSYLIGSILFEKAAFAASESFFQKAALYVPSLIISTAIAFMLSTLFRNQALAVGVGIFVLWISSTLNSLLILLMHKFAWVKLLIFSHMNLTVYATQPELISGVNLTFSIIVLSCYYFIFMLLTFFFFQKRDVSF
ncbi:ABC transporter permease [Bacillus chungangensis]|uniref:ABC-2 type transport system permease protein n=1 Tax=Bacillus chungangensis TaxID=587633 RepID=A0ABT9WPN9_9BACI|nr:ABC transporter permease [Bacillus chungangensis]MDQ0175175.1 ABC-2 type transport system permease protein [Bacillus chungangensis]